MRLSTSQMRETGRRNAMKFHAAWRGSIEFLNIIDRVSRAPMQIGGPRRQGVRRFPRLSHLHLYESLDFRFRISGGRILRRLVQTEGACVRYVQCKKTQRYKRCVFSAASDSGETTLNEHGLSDVNCQNLHKRSIPSRKHMNHSTMWISYRSPGPGPSFFGLP
jgi:hypothetical protein